MRAGKASPDIRFGAQIATTIGLMKAGEETAPTPSNYGYTLRRANGASLGRALFVEHSASLHFSATPGHGAVLVDRRAPCRDVLDQIRLSAGLRIS